MAGAETKPRLSYFICTGPRTGSTLLSSALERTGIAGRPLEYFDVHAAIQAHWQQRLSIADPADYFGKIVAEATTPNGVMGVKLHWHQAIALRQAIEAEAGPDGTAPSQGLDSLLRARLGATRYIWLRRNNTVAQAISYYRATQTDIWRLSAGETAPAKTVVYDHAEIARHVKLVEDFNRAWYQFLMRQRLKALIVVYEDFVDAYEKTVRGVLGYLGLNDPALQISTPRYARQADSESGEWERRFRQAGTQAPQPFVAKRSRRAPRPTAAPAKSELKLIAYDLGTGVDLPIEPAGPLRPWMDATYRRFAYRCLPLVIANQSGWFIRGTHRLTVVWDGSDRPDGVSVTYDDEPPHPYASGHFGCGILTFNFSTLFRTPPGYNLHVRGPANWPKDGISPLEGVVETDWNRASFTMNWRLTRPGHPVTFEAGEPVAMLSLLPRGEQERVRPEIHPIASDPDWQHGFLEWSRSRSSFADALKQGQPEAVAAGWQRHYQLGVGVEGHEAPEHQTALSLAPVQDKRPPRG